MGAAPSEASLARFAEEYPDRWGVLVSTLARTGGFSDKTEVIGNIHVTVHQMSDAELKQRIQELEAARRPVDAVFAIIEPVKAAETTRE